MDRFKIGLLFAFLFIFSFALLVGGTIPYFILYIFSLTFLIPLFHSLITLRGLKGSVTIPSKSLFSGDSVDIEYQVQNNNILPTTYLEVESHISKQLTGASPSKEFLSLGKKMSFRKKESIVLQRRGYYQLGKLIVTTGDVFGFYHLKKGLVSDISLLVYPETINLSSFKIAISHQSGELSIRDNTFHDKTRIASLREYREGDGLRDIHWKLSAKKDIPVVKDYESSGDTHIIVFMDNEITLFENDIDRRLEDKAVDASLSIINYCLENNIRIDLITQNNKSIVEVQGEGKSQLKPFLDTLARFKGDGLLHFKSILIPRMDLLKRNSTVVIITPNLDKSMGSHGIYLRMKNLNPIFIVIVDKDNTTGYIDPAIEKSLRLEGIPVYIIDYKTSIKEALEVYNG